VGKYRRSRRGWGRAGGAGGILKLIPPGLVVAVLLVLITSQLCFAFLRYRRRAYIPILLMTAVGFGLGQLWDYFGLPSARLGQANILPAVAFALLLQPLARFVPRRSSGSREPTSSKEGTRT